MRSLIAVLAVAALVGCQKQTYVDRQKINTEPLVIDQAMQQRQWEPVTARYENGDIHSSSTGFAYAPQPIGNYPITYSLSDTGTFLVNLVTMPYTFFDQKDGVVSRGVSIPPSYTANPPLPPSPPAAAKK